MTEGIRDFFSKETKNSHFCRSVIDLGCKKEHARNLSINEEFVFFEIPAKGEIKTKIKTWFQNKINEQVTEAVII